MKKRPIYYDTETTGINAQKDRIVEIAAYDPTEDCSFRKKVSQKVMTWINRLAGVIIIGFGIASERSPNLTAAIP